MKKFFLFTFVIIFASFASANDYSIQFGSFKTKVKANKAIQNMKGKIDTTNCYIVRTDLGEKGIWYRVQYGRFQLKEEAIKALELFKKKNIDSILVKCKENEPSNITVLPHTKANTKNDLIIADNNTTYNTKNLNTINETLDFKVRILNNLWIKAVQKRNITKIKEMIPKYKKLLNQYYDSNNIYKVYYMIAHSFLQLKQEGNTIIYLDKAFDTAPKEEKSAILFEKGYVTYIFVQNYDKAMDIFKRVCIEFPASPWALAAQKNINQILKYKVYNIN